MVDSNLELRLGGGGGGGQFCFACPAGFFFLLGFFLFFTQNKGVGCEFPKLLPLIRNWYFLHKAIFS